MSFLKLNGLPVISATITMPLVGAWYADLVVDDQSAPAGPALLSAADDSVIFSGFSYRGGVTREKVMVRVVGGGGGLATQLNAKHYRAVPLRLPLLDILTQSKEKLSASASPDILNRQLGSWSRTKGLAGESIRALAESAGASWRVLRDGSVWLGVETWPDFSLSYEIIDEAPHSGRIEIWSEAPQLIPGVTLNGRRISKVEHLISEKIRTTAWFGDSADDPLTAIEGIIRHLTAHIDYYAQYPARVVAQNSDDSLEVIPDDSRLPGLSRVPIRYGVPGIKAKIAPGGRVAVEFAAGNPEKPVATVWESASVLKLEISAAQVVFNNGAMPIARVGDMAGPYPISTGNLTILG